MLGKASDMGCLDSSLHLGRLLLSQCAQGSEVTAESSRGVELIRMAADAGNVGAMKELAEILTTGKGVERNDSAASRYRMLAGQAEQGASTPPRNSLSCWSLCSSIRCISSCRKCTYLGVPIARMLQDPGAECSAGFSLRLEMSIRRGSRGGAEAGPRGYGRRTIIGRVGFGRGRMAFTFERLGRFDGWGSSTGGEATI
jgi:hypothetical protein